jgi:alpha-mannosidase
VNRFPQLVPNRVAAILNRLQAVIWQPLGECAIEASAPRENHLPWHEAKNLPRQPLAGPQHWGKLFDQRWSKVQLPTPLPAPPPYYLRWADQGEATLYVDGVPFYGFDVAHRRVALPPKFDELWVESICVQSAIWHPDATGLDSTGSRFVGAFLERRDDVAWAAYHDLKCLFDVLLAKRPEGSTIKAFGFQPLASRCAPELRILNEKLSDLCDVFDRSGKAALHSSANAVLAKLSPPHSWAQAALNGHAHIDLVWLWPEKVGEAKAVHTFATANRLLSLYPEFRFSYSQPASYEAVARRSPSLARLVRRRIESGEWSATGALYVESDPLLPCGEALARSFVWGQRAFVDLQGKPSPVLWLPDVFGYPGCLPQMILLSGAKYFFTTKLTWNAINRFPHSSFIWRGNDGSEVVAHVTQEAGYNNQLEVAEIITAAEANAQCGVHPEFLHPTGFGDGGGGPTEEMCERASRLSQLLGLPQLVWKHPDDFFQELEQHRERLPVYHGECYVEAHRGTYTTHGRLKLAFRHMERALQAREAVAVVTQRPADLSVPWKRLIFAQFHDYIPGSSIIDVYREGVPELERLTDQLETEVLNELASGGVECVFNPLPLPLATLYNGRPLTIPPLSGIALSDAEFVPTTRARMSGNWLTNGRVEARVTDGGELESLVIDGDRLALEPGSGRLVCMLDRAAGFEAWDIDHHVAGLPLPGDPPFRVERETCREGMWAEISFHQKLGQHSEAVTRYRLIVDSPVLHVSVDLRWEEAETLLKYELNTAYRYGQARCGAPFGTVFRSQTSAGDAMWEIPASRHVSVTHEGGQQGLTVVTESKYGFSIQDGRIGLSLVRSPRITGFDDRHSAAYPRPLARSQPESIYSDQGRHTIRFGVARFSTALPHHLTPAALAETLFAKLISYRGKPVQAPGLRGIQCSTTLIPVWTVPESKTSWILRLHEVGGESGVATVDLIEGWRMALVDFRGNLLSQQPLANAVAFRPNQILSIRFEYSVSS